MSTISSRYQHQQETNRSHIRTPRRLHTNHYQIAVIPMVTNEILLDNQTQNHNHQVIMTLQAQIEPVPKNEVDYRYDKEQWIRHEIEGTGEFTSKENYIHGLS